jgi:hypothetical protein
MKAAPYRSALCVFLCAFSARAAAGPLDAPPGAPLIHSSGQHLNTTLPQPQPLPQPPSRDNRRGPHHWSYPSGTTLNIRPPPGGASVDNHPPPNSHTPFARPTDTGLNVAPTGGNAATGGNPATSGNPPAGNPNFPVSPTRPQATPVNLSAPFPAPKGHPNQAPRPATTDTGITTALAFRDFLYGIRGEDVICQSIAAMLAVTLGADGCAEEIANARKTVALQVIVTDGGEKIYELVVRGNSAEMALSEGTWIERHRFYVTFGFDGRLEPHLTVFDFEPMFRTTAGLYPEREKQYEYIARDRDSALREFQEKVKSAISSALEVAFKRQVGAR